MAYLDDLSEEERTRQNEALDLGGGAAAAGGGGGGGPAPATAAASAPSSGFANLSQYFAANQGQAQAQGAEMVGNLGEGAESALRSDDPGTAMDTLGQINAAATPGGLATTLTTGEDPNYTAGQAGLDAYLGTRGSDPGAFAGLREMYGDRLSRVESAVPMPETPAFWDLSGPRPEGPEWHWNPTDASDPVMPQGYDEQLAAWNAWRDRRQMNIDGTHAAERLPYMEGFYGSVFPDATIPYSNDEQRPEDEEEAG